MTESSLFDIRIQTPSAVTYPVNIGIIAIIHPATDDSVGQILISHSKIGPGGSDVPVLVKLF